MIWLDCYCIKKSTIIHVCGILFPTTQAEARESSPSDIYSLNSEIEKQLYIQSTESVNQMH